MQMCFDAAVNSTFDRDGDGAIDLAVVKGSVDLTNFVFCGLALFACICVLVMFGMVKFRRNSRVVLYSAANSTDEDRQDE